MAPDSFWKMVGYIGLACYFGRMLLQWIASERAGRSVVPRLFWHLSLAGALCMLAYAFSLRDAVFVLSLLPGAFVYVRNLTLKYKVPHNLLLPLAAALLFFVVWAVILEPFTGSIIWTAVGMLGSVSWSGRFIVQWWVSERKGESTLPVSFWVLSLIGNILLLAYAIHRRDPVFIPGQSIGYLVYMRNLYLIWKTHKGSTLNDAD